MGHIHQKKICKSFFEHARKTVKVDTFTVFLVYTSESLIGLSLQSLHHVKHHFIGTNRMATTPGAVNKTLIARASASFSSYILEKKTSHHDIGPIDKDRKGSCMCV